MKHHLARLLALLLLATPIILGAATPDAAACSPIPTVDITLDDLLALDFNEPDSELVQRYIDYGFGGNEPFTILGAYHFESVQTLEPSGEWTRGSVIAPLQSWGRVPRDNRTPWVQEAAIDDPGHTCGSPSGLRLGFRTIRLVFSPDVEQYLYFSYDRNDEAAAVAALTEAFGAPTIIERDATEEARLFAILEDQRSDERAQDDRSVDRSDDGRSEDRSEGEDGATGEGSSSLPPMLIALVAAILAAGWVMYMRRGRHIEQLQADPDAELPVESPRTF